MSTTTNLDTLKINYLTQAQYDEALANDEINENELYMTPSDVEVEDLVAKNIVVTGTATISGNLNVAGTINNDGTYGESIPKAAGTVTVAAAQTYSIVSVTLPANGKYIVLADVVEGQGSTQTSLCSISCTNVASSYGAGLARVYAGAGQGVNAWLYVETGSSSGTATVNCYGYYTTSHSVSGHIIAIPIHLI